MLEEFEERLRAVLLEDAARGHNTPNRAMFHSLVREMRKYLETVEKKYRQAGKEGFAEILQKSIDWLDQTFGKKQKSRKNGCPISENGDDCGKNLQRKSGGRQKYRKNL